MDWLKISVYSMIFLIGFLSCLVVVAIGDKELPLGIGNAAGELKTPGNWIDEKQIHVYNNAIVIDVANAGISEYADTGSMIPILNENSNGIRIVPQSAEQIDVGDIITFQSEGELIIHRVIEKGEDSEGTYFVTQGDNNNVSNGKIRFKDIKYVTIGIIW